MLSVVDTFAPTITGIVIPVPEAAAWAPYPHITLLAPFGQDSEPTSDEVEEVRRFFADVTPFDVTLVAETAFPGGVRYLAPEPASTFSRLTHALHRLFPEYPPYGGAFDVVVPHLTVRDDAVVDGLPLRSRATAATLCHTDGGRFEVRTTFPFGTSAA